MEGDGMVAVVRGLREAGLAVTLLDGNRQYTLLPNSTTVPASSQPASAQRTAPVTIVNAATQQCPLKATAENGTEPPAPQCDRDAQAVDGRYTSMYKTMHCNMRPTSPPVQLTEFPPQRPDVYPGHGNFIVGGSGSGVTGHRSRSPTCSSVNSFRGGMCWPDRGSVCSPRPSRAVDAFANSLRKYPNCLSPDRSSEVMERLINYSQVKGVSRSFRSTTSPTRSTDPSSQNVLDPKPYARSSVRSRNYEPDVTIHPKKTEDPPTRDRKKDERPIRGCDVRCVKDMSKKTKEGVKAYTSYPYNLPVCPPTIRENQDYGCNFASDSQNSTNSVNMEIQAAVKMLSKEVATLPREETDTKTVAVPESPIPSGGEDYVEGEYYLVENLDIRTSIKSIQTNFYASDTTLRPRKSAQTVFSTIDFHSRRNRTIVSRKTKSQEEIKVTKDELKMSLLELINEISDTVAKNTIRDELIKKLFVTDTCEKNEHKCDRGKCKHDNCYKYVTNCCPKVCDYVGDYKELVGKLKHCYGDSKNVLRSEIKPFRLSEYRQLDFVLKDWVNQLNINTSDIGRYVDKNELLNSVEERIKELLKNWTKQDFDLKSEIVEILLDIPIEVNKSYNMKSYLRKLVDVLLKRMRNVIVTQQSGNIKKRSFANRSRKILTEDDMRDFVRVHLIEFLNEYNSRFCQDTVDDLENELVDLIMDSIDCIWCGHDDEIVEEMDTILQDLGKMTDKEANYISNIMLEDLQDMLNNCIFNQTYTILNVSNNSGQYMNSKNYTDSSIGSITEGDLQANLDRYTNQLCLQINQWLDTLDIPRIQDTNFREVVVNDLAGDIVDRHKYVELNHTDRDSAQEQLEALKYQIFKWINKLVGDENQETIGHAEDLLQRINSVPVPMLVHPKHRSGPCCEMDNSICPNATKGSPKPYPQPAQGFDQSRQCCGMNICPHTSQGNDKKRPCCKMKICPNQGTSTQVPPGIVSHADQFRRVSYGHSSQEQGCPYNRGGNGRSFGPSSPNNPWGSNTFSSGFESSQIGNLSQIGHGNASAGRMRTSERVYGSLDVNQQAVYDPNPQAVNMCCDDSSAPHTGGSVPVKKINEDYDEYLKKWVKNIPIAAKTHAEELAAETTRLGIYNGIWKSVTKMKLDPNIFGNQHYCQDILEEEMERLLKAVPQSQELEAAKPTMKAELLQKTLTMNNLIKSTNAPASFKQQLVDNIENNLPERTANQNEEDKENYELEKQNLADLYILYMRYRDEDNAKAIVYKTNFLKRLDDFLDKVKKRHGLVNMDIITYANEIINSFDKTPTPNYSAVKDEADDILLSMEVEKWISDIPQKPDNAGPLEKRRTRDAIVKKIQEIAIDVSCCDNSFRVPLKSELPKYLEKIPIQEGTNVDYMVDELANRIKNLSTSLRRVSFQEPQNYEEFSRFMPAASSLHEMSDERSSYIVVGGEIVKDLGPRRPAWVRDKLSIPEEDIEWLSLEQTQMPSHIRTEAQQRMRSQRVYNPVESGQMPQRTQLSQVYNPNASVQRLVRSYVGEGSIPRDAGPNRSWVGEQAAVPQKRQQISLEDSQLPSDIRNKSRQSENMRSQQYNPNDSRTARSYPGERNLMREGGPGRANWVSDQVSVRQEESAWLSLEESYMPSQMRSISIAPQNRRSPQMYCPNTSDQMANQISRGGQEVDGPFSPSAAPFGPNGQGPCCSNNPGQFASVAQGQPPPNLQSDELCTGPPCCPNLICLNRSHGYSGSEPCSQPAAHSPGPREQYGQGSLNAQGISCCNVPNASLTGQGFPGQDSPGRHSQSYEPVFSPVQENIQNYSVPGSQMQQQGLHTPRTSQSSKSYNQVVPGCAGGQTCQGPHYQPNISQGQGPGLNNNRQSYGFHGLGSWGPGGRMSHQGPNATQINYVDQEPCCKDLSNNSGGPHQTGQASYYGVIEGSRQNHSLAQQNARAQARHSPSPVSAANEISAQAPKPYNLHKMATGGLGLLGTSQVPGPSSQSLSVPTTNVSNTPCCTIPEAQAVGSQPGGICTNGRGEQQIEQSEEKQSTDSKQRTDLEKKTPKEHGNSKIKHLDKEIKSKEVFNFKSVQTAFSTIDITTTKCKYCEIRSKSQEELTKKMKREEVIKRTGLGNGDLQQEVTEWFEIHSDKVKVKLWGDKMKKLAEKLKKPGGEEKLRSKIEKYLSQAPEQCTESGDDNLEFRKQLPYDIIRKLKKMYLHPAERNISIYRMEVPKFCSRFKIDNFKKVVLNWTKTLNIKKKDFLGRSVKKEDIFKYIADKLEPLVFDRPQSDVEYKVALQSKITDIVYELPLAVSSHNKDFYINKIIQNLVDNIFMIENKLSCTYIQPTTQEIKEFVKDEITFFLEKCRVAISTKRMEYLETELINILLNLIDIADIDSYVADDVTKLLKEAGKLPEYKAKYFTNLLLKDYKEFFFRENFFQLKPHSDRERPDVYSAFQNASSLVDFNAATSFETYRQRLTEEINKWISKLNIPNIDKHLMEVVVKDLASDIVDRYKYLLLNPSLSGTDTEELEQLKFQIFKWTNKLVGEDNTSVLEHAQDLMIRINNVPKPFLQNTSPAQSMSPLDLDKMNGDNPKSYIDILTDQIYDWYCELPTDLHVSQDVRQNKLITKELAENIDKGLEKKEIGVVDEEIGKWTEKVFNDRLSDNDVQQLKNRIYNVPYTKDDRINDLKHEKTLVRSYEDIIDEWLDTIPIASSKQGFFADNKNEIVHAIAVKIFKIKTKIKHLPDEVVEKKLQEELSHWLKKLPLQLEANNQNDRNKFAVILASSLQKYKINDPLENQPKLASDEPIDIQLERVMLEWLKRMPLYREKTLEDKVNQETTMKRLAHKLVRTIGDEESVLEDITEQIKRLDPKQNDNYVQATACQLKSYLQNLDLYKDLCKKHEEEYKCLVNTIEVWLKALPLNVKDANRFNKQKNDFIKSVNQLVASGSGNAVMKKKILMFMRTLPISHTKKYDTRFLNGEVSKLIQSLKAEPNKDDGDTTGQSPSKSIELIRDIIKKWGSSLPLKRVHCSRELRSFIDEMCLVVSSLLLNPDCKSIAQNEAKLHREISKFLRRFPLIYELSTESHIFRLAGELSRTLKNTSLYRNANFSLSNNVPVYGVSFEDKGIIDGYSKEGDINQNLETYTKQLVQQIREWFDRLNLPVIQQVGFKEVVINDLAGDIVDRQKYLELNPNRSTEEDELEHLKYQIFKWINKLVGDENPVTIGHAVDLMQRVKSIPVPMFVRHLDKGHAESSRLSQHQRSQRNAYMEQRNNGQVNSPIRKSGIAESAIRSGKLESAQQPAFKRMSGPNHFANLSSKACCSQEPPPPPPPSEVSTKEAMFDKFNKTFQDFCNELPIDESTPYNAMLATQARRAIHNGIIKTFFNLKADPNVENDYRCFEFMLEERLDNFLDVLPQTEEFKKMRHSWKTRVLESAIELLDELHKMTDMPCFRQAVRNKFNRQLAIDQEIQTCFILQQGFLTSVADLYLLEINYKEKDPVKAKIYKNRLMTAIDKLINHLSKEHNVGFRFFDKRKLTGIVLKSLEHVPVPTDDVLQDEVEIIHLADEVENWYKQLPTQPSVNELDDVTRKRMIGLLAKKLHDINKYVNDADPSKECKIKHEMSQFLEKRGHLQEDEDLNINYMVDDLHSRLMNKWLRAQAPEQFDEFNKAKPLSSTLAHVNNAELLAPLMDAGTSTGQEPFAQIGVDDQGYFIQPGQAMQSLGQVRTSYGDAPYSVHGSGIPGSPHKATIHSMDPNLSRQIPYASRMSPGGASAGAPSMQAPVGRHRGNLEGSQFRPDQGHITNHSPDRSNLCQQLGSPRQASVVRQSLQGIQSPAHTLPKSRHETLHGSQMGSHRAQNINQSLRQMEPHGMQSQILGPAGSRSGGQGQLFVPSDQGCSQGQCCSELPGNLGSLGPTPSQGAGTTAQAAVYTGAPVSSEEDMLDGEFRIKCRCLEAYRRMRSFDDEEGCDRFKNYRRSY